MTKLEKEYPVVEIKVDILKVIEAKIEKLADEEEVLYNKRMKLIEVVEYLKEQKIL